MRRKGFFLGGFCVVCLGLAGCDNAQQLLDEAQKKAQELTAQKSEAPTSTESSAPSTTTPSAPSTPSNPASAAPSEPAPSPVAEPRTDEEILAEWDAIPPAQRTNEALQRFAELSEEGRQSVIKIDLTGSQVTAAGMEAILAFTRLQELILSKNLYVDTAALDIVSRLPELEILMLDGCPIANGALDPLGESKSLRVLSVKDAHLTDRGLEALDGVSTLEAIVISGNKDVEGSFLVGAEYLPSLKRLEAEKTKFGLKGFGPLGKAPRLEVLNANEALVSDTAMKGLDKHTQFVELHLSMNPITDVGLAYLKGSAKLEVIDLKYTKVTAQGVAVLRTCKKLRVCDVRMSPVDSQQLEILKRQMPRVDFRR